jgi:hypothetical protein
MAGDFLEVMAADLQSRRRALRLRELGPANHMSENGSGFTGSEIPANDARPTGKYLRGPA